MCVYVCVYHVCAGAWVARKEYRILRIGATEGNELCDMGTDTWTHIHSGRAAYALNQWAISSPSANI